MSPFGFPTPALAQSPPPQTAQREETDTFDARETDASAGEPDGQLSGYITGTVLDKSGAVALGAQVRLTRDDPSPTQEVLSGGNGQFSFANVPPGPFLITIAAEGFETQKASGALLPKQAYLVPAIRLAVATVVTEVRAAVTQIEVAQDQIKEQEKQRVLGFIPNFLSATSPMQPPSLRSKKFELAWKSTIEPFTFVGVAVLSGVKQATDNFEGYGQGVQGNAKRFGAAHANVVSGTFIGSAVLPSLLKQDRVISTRESGALDRDFCTCLPGP